MKNQNQMYQKQKKAEINIPASVTAEIVGCSESLVKQVRTGDRNASKGAGAKVAVVDDLLTTGTNALIQHIKEVVKLG
ncbi:hypothetical protein [Pedobacter terrae]|nr:hypothetical protein [Pedobacter terrae]